MADDYKIKSNKHSKVQPPYSDVIGLLGIGGTGSFMGVVQLYRKITGYQKPEEEKEHVLDKIPGPDFEITSKTPEKDPK